MNELLSDTARESLLPPLYETGWAPVEGRDAIVKTFEFKDFAGAFAWMTHAALWAEKWNHHPEWCNVWNKVTVTLITHDADGLSSLDAKLARKLDSL
ncbi:MAG: 4a-hydroxytetrahydrobiopterin dehydratase [Paracoccaceae bacterium]